MRRGILLAGFAVIVAASPASQAIDFASVAAAPAPSLTGPPAGANTQDVPYIPTSVAAAGSAKATGVQSASASASQAGNNKRWGWPWSPEPTSTYPAQGGYPTTKQPSYSTTTQPSYPTTQPTYPTSKPSSSTTKPYSQPPSTTVQPSTSVSQTTSSESSCPTQPEAGTYCGFINPEDPCAPQPDGYGPHVVPDTVAAFEAYPEFHANAKTAKTPAGYGQTFVDLNASVSANTYLGLHTLKTYDTQLCGDFCNNKTLCTGFNIFIERDPSLNPSDNCTQPPSITNYKCTLWGSGVDTESATNTGQNRGAFQVVIVGSNGYERSNTTTPPAQPGWQPPQHCGGDGSKGHNHPSTCMGTGFFPGPYDPSYCAAYAQSQNAINKKSPFWIQWFQYFTGTYNPYHVTFFNSFMLKKNGHALGTYCALFSEGYSGESATYAPGWQGSDYWTIESSWSYSIDASYGW